MCGSRSQPTSHDLGPVLQNKKRDKDPVVNIYEKLSAHVAENG